MAAVWGITPKGGSQNGTQSKSAQGCTQSSHRAPFSRDQILRCLPASLQALLSVSSTGCSWHAAVCTHSRSCPSVLVGCSPGTLDRRKYRNFPFLECMMALLMNSTTDWQRSSNLGWHHRLKVPANRTQESHITGELLLAAGDPHSPIGWVAALQPQTGHAQLQWQAMRLQSRKAGPLAACRSLHRLKPLARPFSCMQAGTACFLHQGAALPATELQPNRRSSASYSCPVVSWMSKNIPGFAASGRGSAALTAHSQQKGCTELTTPSLWADPQAEHWRNRRCPLSTGSQRAPI